MLINNITIRFTANVNHQRIGTTGINDDLNRARTLGNLYLSSAKGKLDAFIESSLTLIKETNYQQQGRNPSEIWKNIDKEYEELGESKRDQGSP
jgi:hypothetical protein